MPLKQLEAPIMHRSVGIDVRAINEEERTVTFSGSSEYEASRWGMVEILDHSKKAIRMDRIREIGAILRNHNPDCIVASIVRAELIEKRIEITAKFTTTEDGEKAFIEVKEGALRGVSVGYRVYKWEVDEENDIYRALDWEPYEFSFTPIPVDPSVGVDRSEESQKELFLETVRSFQVTTNRETQTEAPMSKRIEESPAGAPADQGERAEGATVTQETAPAAPAPETPAQRSEPAPAPAAAPAPAQPANDISDAQAIARHAESLNLRASDYVGLSRSEAHEKMLQDVANRGSEPVGTRDIEVGADMHDKRAEHFSGKLLESGSLESLRSLCYENGQQRVETVDIIHQILGTGKYKGQRALETASSLGNVTVLAADKALVKGYDMYQPWWPEIASIREVDDFKTVHSAGLSFGAFTAPGEGSPFTDMSADDIGDTGSIAMRGGLARITEQALWNDGLRIWFQTLQQTGYMARLDEDTVIKTALEAADFTAATEILAYSTANLKTAFTSFINQTNASGHKLGLPPTKILVPPALYIGATEDTTNAQGETTARIFSQGKHILKPVLGVNLTSATTWWLAADPGMANGLQLLKHSAYPRPKVIEYDAGATAARNFKVQYPTGGMVNNMKATAPVGLYKLTAA